MFRLLAALVAIAACPAIRAADLPKETAVIHSVQFSDPQGTSLTGGNAFDRAAIDIGVDKTQTNTALVTITPAKVAGQVQFTTDGPAIATPSPTTAAGSPQTLTITGQGKGIAFISTKRYPAARMGAATFTPQQVTIALHIISDSAGHSAGITASQVSSIVQVVNTIWGNQTNVTFGPSPIITANTVSGDLGPSVDFISGTNTTDYIAVTNAARNPAVPFNVYFVSAITVDGAADDGVAPDDGTGNVFVATNSKDINRSTAHELGHALGLRASLGFDVDYVDSGGPTTRRYQLMYGNSADVPIGGGRTVTPFQGNGVNPTF
jgi:hypothetical protein